MAAAAAPSVLILEQHAGEHRLHLSTLCMAVTPNEGHAAFSCKPCSKQAAKTAAHPSLLQGTTDRNTGGGPTTIEPASRTQHTARDLSWCSTTSCSAILPHMFGLNRSTTYAGGTDFGYRTRMAGRLVSTVLAAPRAITRQVMIDASNTVAGPLKMGSDSADSASITFCIHIHPASALC
jgi:hypothetical protein